MYTDYKVYHTRSIVKIKHKITYITIYVYLIINLCLVCFVKVS